jgi:hypothetical protein
MRAQMDVPFKFGSTVRVEGNRSDFVVSLLDCRYDDTNRVTTDNPDDLRQLAKALNQVADFIEGRGE